MSRTTESQRPGHRGPRPPVNARYRNRPMDRDPALDVVADAGLLLAAHEPTRITLRASGEGYDAVLPVEHLEVLVATVARQADEIRRLKPAQPTRPGPPRKSP